MDSKHIIFTNKHLSGLEIKWGEGEDFLDIRLNGEAVDKMRLDEPSYEHASEMVKLIFRIMQGEGQPIYLH
jgi:hypothetical protein